MVEASKFAKELAEFDRALSQSESVLITSPATADGDSLGAQLALRRMITLRDPQCKVSIINDDPLPERYLFMPDVQWVYTPETFSKTGEKYQFDMGIIVDGGIDRAGRVKEVFDQCKTTVFIDHHSVSCDYPYKICMVEPTASSTTELVYHISQTNYFNTPTDREFAQQIYLGLIFDTGFFRHSNTTPEALELAAKLLRCDFDFTRVGERGMLERSFSSLQLLSDTLSRAELRGEGKIIFSTLTQAHLRKFSATDDDREGIIDHLFLTHGIEVAILFFEIPNDCTKLSIRSQGGVDVARFARSLTERGGGHQKAAGAFLEVPITKAVDWVLKQLEATLTGDQKIARA